jgi:hypothetical protein
VKCVIRNTENFAFSGTLKVRIDWIQPRDIAIAIISYTIVQTGGI